MSWKNLCSQIDPTCIKTDFTYEEYVKVKSSSSRVNATELYHKYGKGLSYPEFRMMLKEKFYYDKFVCEHGVEFVYYIKFKDREERLTYDDLLYVIPAVSRKKDV